MNGDEVVVVTVGVEITVRRDKTIERDYQSIDKCIAAVREALPLALDKNMIVRDVVSLAGRSFGVAVKTQ